MKAIPSTFSWLPNKIFHSTKCIQCKIIPLMNLTAMEMKVIDWRGKEKAFLPLQLSSCDWTFSVVYTVQRLAQEKKNTCMLKSLAGTSGAMSYINWCKFQTFKGTLRLTQQFNSFNDRSQLCKNDQWTGCQLISGLALTVDCIDMVIHISNQSVPPQKSLTWSFFST